MQDFLAKRSVGDEGIFVWDNAKVKLISNYDGKKKNPFILLTSFNAG